MMDDTSICAHQVAKPMSKEVRPSTPRPQVVPFREYRLKTRNDYLACKRGGIKYFFNQMCVYCRKNSFGHARIGCSVSTKLGDAVERNLFRRRLKEAFRTHADLSSPSFDIHLIPQQKVSAYSWQDIKQVVDHVLTCLGKI